MGGLAFGENPDQIWRPFITASTSRCACALSMLYLATTWVTRSSLFLSAPSSCSENLPHLAPISLRRICLFSTGLPVLAEAVFGVAGVHERYLQNIDETSFECASFKPAPLIW